MHSILNGIDPSIRVKVKFEFLDKETGKIWHGKKCVLLLPFFMLIFFQVALNEVGKREIRVDKGGRG